VSQISDRKVARRYASALFSTARKAGKTEAIQRDLESLLSLWQRIPALRRALESPRVSGERKRALIDRTLRPNLEALTVSFLNLLVRKRREELLDAVQEEFRRQADDARGLVRAEATIALPLDKNEQAELHASLEAHTGKTIELTVNVDPAILGGVLVRLQDTVIDGSVRGALERLRAQMLQER
jgi:F-type H+-transporting ATPase subunit delta